MALGFFRSDADSQPTHLPLTPAVGRRAVDGSFQDFTLAVTQAPLEVKGLNVRYNAPGIGEVVFGWEGPLSVDGVEVPLSGYKRFDNPYAQVDFGSLQYVIEYNGLHLRLDFEKGMRESGR